MLLFTAETLDAAIKQWKDSPFIGHALDIFVSTIGGKGKATLYVRGSLDPKEMWKNGIIQNSRFFNFALNVDGSLELTTHSRVLPKFRKAKVKSIPDAVTKINNYLRSAGSETAGVRVLVRGMMERALYDQDDRQKTFLSVSYKPGVDLEAIKSVMSRYAKGVKYKAANNSITVTFVTTTQIAGKIRDRMAVIPNVTYVQVFREDEDGETNYLSKFGWEPILYNRDYYRENRRGG